LGYSTGSGQKNALFLKKTIHLLAKVYTLRVEQKQRGKN
jgi:hypothetical protein